MSSPTSTTAGDLATGLVDALEATLNTTVTISDLARVPAGASRQTWSFRARVDGAVRAMILRLDLPGARADSSLAREARLMHAAHHAGVASPEVIATGAHLAGHGGEYVVMSRVSGESIPRKILRDSAFDAVRPRLAAQLGSSLARLHTIDTDQFADLPDGDQLALWADELHRHDRPSPTFEYALAWLRAHVPDSTAQTLVHGDFRLGNFLIEPDGVRAVLDWELAHRGDPLEDLGWMCVKAWRFGGEPPVGGLGGLDDFVGAYELQSGTEVDRTALFWWQVFGTLRWGIMCVNQAERHRSGAARSVELAAIGRRVSENEWELLELLG